MGEKTPQLSLKSDVLQSMPSCSEFQRALIDDHPHAVSGRFNAERWHLIRLTFERCLRVILSFHTRRRQLGLSRDYYQ